MPWPVSNSVPRRSQNKHGKRHSRFRQIQRSQAGGGSVMGLSGWTSSTNTTIAILLTNSPRLASASPESGGLLALALGLARTTAGGVLGAGCCPAASWDWLGVGQSVCGIRSSPHLVLDFRWRRASATPAGCVPVPCGSASGWRNGTATLASTGESPHSTPSWERTALRLGAEALQS